MSTMNIGDILDDLPEMEAGASVLLRGDHGIGKSSLIRQVAGRIREREKRPDMPIIDRRLSQMTQGDIIGLPKLDDDRTRYMPPDWYKTACERPVILFLDELNRAEMEVMQAAFQIVLDRELNGHKLHPDTRVYAAVNTRSRYNVNQIDPALLDRFFVIDVNFTTAEWLKWARSDGDLTPEVVDFILRNETYLTTPAQFSPGEVVQSPRSWEFADRNVRSLLEAGRRTGVYDYDRIRRRMAGYVGADVAMIFIDDLKVSWKFSGEDILERYGEMRHLFDRGRIDLMVSATEKLIAHCTPLNGVNEHQGKNLETFIWDLEKDHRVTLWQRLAQGGAPRLPFVRSMHKYVVHAVLDSFGVPAGPKGIGIMPGIHGVAQIVGEENQA